MLRHISKFVDLRFVALVSSYFTLTWCSGVSGNKNRARCWSSNGAKRLPSSCGSVFCVTGQVRSRTNSLQIIELEKRMFKSEQTIPSKHTVSQPQTVSASVWNCVNARGSIVCIEICRHFHIKNNYWKLNYVLNTFVTNLLGQRCACMYLQVCMSILRFIRISVETNWICIYILCHLPTYMQAYCK